LHLISLRNIIAAIQVLSLQTEHRKLIDQQQQHAQVCVLVPATSSKPLHLWQSCDYSTAAEETGACYPVADGKSHCCASGGICRRTTNFICRRTTNFMSVSIKL
jgi:hypothetical protein